MGCTRTCVKSRPGMGLSGSLRSEFLQFEKFVVWTRGFNPTSMLPRSFLERLDVDQLHPIDWLEQLPSGEFVRRSIERGEPKYAAMTIGDINRDGLPDVVAGVFNRVPLAPPLKFSSLAWC